MKNKFSIKKNGYIERVKNADRMGLGEDSVEIKVDFARYLRDYWSESLQRLMLESLQRLMLESLQHSNAITPIENLK